MATVDELIQQLESGNTIEQNEAAIELGKLGDSIAVPALIRSRVVDRLIQIVRKDDAPIDHVVAARAAEPLGKTRDPKAIPVLLERLRGGKPYETAKAAARALRHFDDPQVVQALTEVATNKKIPKTVREAAVQSLGDIGNPNAVDALISILEDSSIEVDVRAEVARALGRTGNPKAIEPLIQRMKSEWKVDKRVLRQAIVDALSAFRDQRAIDALLWALSTDYYIARAAAESLKKLRDRRAVEPLIRLVDPPDDKANYREHEREFAAQILGAIGDPRAIPALVNALRDDYCERLPQYAAESLQSFVPTHPDAILRLPPEDRHRLGRLIQDSERNELAEKLCK
jgi:HEAT repeat protein